VVALRVAEVFGLEEAPRYPGGIRAVGVDASLRRKITSVWTKLFPRGYRVAKSHGCLDM